MSKLTCSNYRCCYIKLILDLARAKSKALVNDTINKKNRVMLNGDDNENGFKTNRSN